MVDPRSVLLGVRVEPADSYIENLRPDPTSDDLRDES